ncbi:MAG: ferredoxin [Oscillospiraceae bacterium]|nr:ferredoxin [Oscillospiraceae bacterium]
MKLELDRDGCIGCGVCAEVCPDVFRIAGDGLSEIIAQPEGNEEAVQEAAESCPVEVIHTDE